MTDSDILKPMLDGRFSRHELIKWWDQRILQQARILVIGAGALGNEVLKNLALLGIGNIFVVDFDTIEVSNLSRSVLFREKDIGCCKAESSAAALKEIYPGINVRGFHGNAIYDLGLGVFKWAQVVLCGLDNREARLETSRKCWKTLTPLVDGGIEELNGRVSMFVPPDGPCYECTMGELDWKLLAERRSCTLLARNSIQAGHVPTTVTTAAIVAAIQCQEAVRWLHGFTELCGKGMFYNGTVNQLHTVEYQLKNDCLGHETLGKLTPLGVGVASMRVKDLLRMIEDKLGPEAVVELNYDVLHEFHCPNCGEKEEVLTSLGKVKESQAECPSCSTMRIPCFLQELNRDCGVLDKTLAQIGVAPFDILTARRGTEQVHVFFDGDAEATLGELPRDD
jgi:molybdopterin/thiamine biosynthesis adenylyltransferase/predicted RNA-binding Zn-ribbon protein involved in translation (DUF1610 family)